VGETRVDLQHLLEDLRDAYTGALEETILTEVGGQHVRQGHQERLGLAGPDAGDSVARERAHRGARCRRPCHQGRMSRLRSRQQMAQRSSPRRLSARSRRCLAAGVTHVTACSCSSSRVRDDAELGRLVESTIWINEAHPAYARATASRSAGYHIALTVALALAPLAVGARGEHAFITQFLAHRGGSESRKTRRRRNRG
jgi:hypothetical protein